MKTLALALATTALAATAASAASIAEFDLNGDRFVSFQEATSVNPKVERQEFRSIDVNRDNRLSSVELQAPGVEAILDRGKGGTAGVRSVADISGGAFVSEGQLTAAYPGLKGHEFDIIDTNNDGRVSSTEIYASAAQSILSEHDNGGGILVSLNSVDTDGSGFATLAELQVAYPGTSANDLRTFDVNRDGRIAFNEFYAPAAVEILGRNK
jgi:hypothetical protein